jgi:hypothetical protein
MNGKMKHILKQHSLQVVQAWIKEDKEEASTVITIALHCKCGSGPTKELEDEEQLQAYCKHGEDHEDKYIKFIAKFGPAMTGVSYWNNNKANIIVSELLTVTDEAFIHLCMINYAPTWKAQHLNTQIPAFVPLKYDVNSSYLPHIYFLFTSPNAHNYLTFSHNYVSAHHIYFLSISYLLPHTTYLPDFCS